MIPACLMPLTLIALALATSSAARAAPREASRLWHDQALLFEASNQLAAGTIFTVPRTSVDGATQVSLDSTGIDRTSMLRSKYEASQHLESARGMCRSLGLINRALVMPVIETIESSRKPGA
jgi:hypothetical protein